MIPLRRLTLAAMTAALALALSACIFGSDDDNGGGSAADYLPLTEGNMWRLTAGQLLSVRWDVYGDSTSNGVTWHGMRIFISQGEAFMQALTGDAAHVDGEIIFKADGVGEGVFLREPVEAGQSWTDEWGSTEILSVGETVSVPAGSFSDVVKVKKETPEGDQIYYFAKGVGPVKAEFTIQSLAIAVELIEYSVN